MPVQFDDAAQQVAAMPNLSDRIAAIFSAFRSRLQQVDGRDKLAELIADLDQHHDSMVRSISGDQSTVTAARLGTLGAGETPFMPGDRPVSVEESERHSNPLSPRDSSGAKIHPADAASLASRQTNPAGGLAFGGNGRSIGADVLTQAGRAAPTRSVQEQELAAEQLNRLPAADGAGPTANDKKMIPVVQNEIVAGSEREEGGVRYVTKRRGDGTEYEALDTRPVNEPV